MPQDFRVTILREAQDQLRSISDRRIAGQIADRIRGLRREPELQGKALWGELTGYRRVRAASGRYRIIYRVVRDRRAVVIVLVGIRREGSRRDVYRVAFRMVQRGLI